MASTEEKIAKRAQEIFEREREIKERYFIEFEAEKIAKQKLYEQDYQKYLAGLCGPKPSFLDRLTGKKMTLDEYIDWREDVWW